uniref:Uncharacterized protein n=1 Tax=Heterorhabditis bacteriophora TaxID=37862 RepID=A0A1I7XN88_HETBA
MNEAEASLWKMHINVCRALSATTSTGVLNLPHSSRIHGETRNVATTFNLPRQVHIDVVRLDLRAQSEMKKSERNENSNENDKVVKIKSSNSSDLEVFIR